MIKKNAAVFILALLAVTVGCGIMGLNIMRGAYLSEIHTVQNIAGRVISAYPETETVFAEAVNDSYMQDIEAGAEILSHYGYDDEKMERNPSYVRCKKFLYVTLVSFFAASVLWLIIFLYVVGLRNKKQEEEVLSILDACLSENFGFINDSERLNKFKNPLFADTLVKIGMSLKLKTAQLNEERDNTKTLVTDISHQLKTSVSALRACFTIYTEAEKEDDREEFLARCKMQMDKLDMLTVALIQISRLETHMITLAIEEVPLAEVLLGAVNTVYHKAKKKQISIVTADFENLSLKIDRKWTIEAIVNILDNAIKYSPEGTEIGISVQKLCDYVRVEIEDNGIGIPKNERTQIFKRFYRGNNELVKSSEGSGVGLYLTRKILGDEGGTVFVRPAKGQGSVFCVNLLT